MAWMRRTGVLALLLTVFLLQGPPAGAADPTAAPTGASITGLLTSFDVDGEPCTGVPNSIPGVFDFTSACQAHDVCYGQGVDRQACDVQFRADMTEACVTEHPDAVDPARYACLTFANLYFAGVRLFGGFFV